MIIFEGMHYLLQNLAQNIQAHIVYFHLTLEINKLNLICYPIVDNKFGIFKQSARNLSCNNFIRFRPFIIVQYCKMIIF